MLSQTQIMKNAVKMLATKQYKKVINLILPILKHEATPATLSAFHVLVGKAFYHLEEYADAIHHLSKALTHFPSDIKLYQLLGLSYFSIRQLENAKNCFLRTIEHHPLKEAYLFNLAGTYKHMSRFDLAEKYYRKIIEQNPEMPTAYRNLSLCVQYTDIHHPDRLQLEIFLKHPKKTNEEKAQYHFALGKIFSDCQYVKEAFEHYKAGNYYKHQGIKFNHAHYSQKITHLIDLFPPEHFSCFSSSWNNPSPKQPIFIIGIPRSGKTLIEKCLAKSPQVLALEEFGMIDKQIFSLSKTQQYTNIFVDLKRDFNNNLISKFTYEYERHAQMHAIKPYTTFTDTTPCNFRYLGFIAQMYPNAKIIHVVRDPFDHILQIFYKFFSTGNFWAYDIKDIIHYYTEYQKMMHYWKSTLSIPIKTISYESLVKNPMSTIQEIYTFAELSINDSVEQETPTFHEKEIDVWNIYKSYLSAFEPLIQKLYSDKLS